MFQIPFLSQLQKFVSLTPLDDTIDSLSCFVTSAIYLFGAILVSARTYVGSAIECWTPQTYSDAWEQYTETYCLLMGTNFLSKERRNMIGPQSVKQDQPITYYQWSSIFLATMSMSFVIPKFIWKRIQGKSDYPLTYFIETTNEIKGYDEEMRKEKVEQMSKMMRSRSDERYYKTSPFIPSLRAGFFFVKGLYLLNIFSQFILVALFLGQIYNLSWGFDLLESLINRNSWSNTGIFPRVSFCSFTVSNSNGPETEHTVQCVLGVNEFNEKIYLFIWWWLVINFVVTLGTTLVIESSRDTAAFITRILIKKNNQRQLAEIKHFLSDGLTEDGLLILSYVRAQSQLIARELVVKLFDEHQEQYGSSPSVAYCDSQRPLLGNEIMMPVE